MTEKKELNLDELEKVSGGAKGWYEGDPTIDEGSFISKSDMDSYIGQNLFYCAKEIWIYGTLNSINPNAVNSYTGKYTAYNVTVFKTNHTSQYKINNTYNISSNQFGSAFSRGTFNVK